MSVRLQTDPHLEFLSLKGDYTGSYESTLVKMPHCSKSHVVAQLLCGTRAKTAHFKTLDAINYSF